MATLNVRLDDKLKKEAYAVLEKLDMTPTGGGTPAVSIHCGKWPHAGEKYDHQ